MKLASLVVGRCLSTAKPSTIKLLVFDINSGTKREQEVRSWRRRGGGHTRHNILVRRDVRSNETLSKNGPRPTDTSICVTKLGARGITKGKVGWALYHGSRGPARCWSEPDRDGQWSRVAQGAKIG